jgi:hypothetical protein
MVSSQPEESMSRLEPSASQPGTPEFPPHQSHRWGLGAFCLVEAVLLLSAVFVGVLLEPAQGGAGVPVKDVLIGTMAPMLIATSLAVFVTYFRGNGPWIDLRLGWRWSDAKTGFKFGLLGLVTTTVAAVIWTKIVGQDNGTSAVSALIDNQPMSVSAAITMFLYLWLLGPVCEEIIYRGLLWGAIERLKWGNEKYGQIAAFLISTAIFALSHLEPLRTTLLLVISIPIGLARLVTGRLIGSIVAHQMNNFLPAIAILLTAFGVLKT